MEIDQILSALTTREQLVMSLQAEEYFWFAPADVIVEDGDVRAYVRAGRAILCAWFIVAGETVTYMGAEN